MADTILNIFYHILILAAIIPVAGFIFFFGTVKTNRKLKIGRLEIPVRVPWLGWARTGIGRALMIQKIAMLAMLLLIESSYIFGDYIGRDIFRVLVYGSLPVMFWTVFLEMRRIQKRHGGN